MSLVERDCLHINSRKEGLREVAGPKIIKMVE